MGHSQKILPAVSLCVALPFSAVADPVETAVMLNNTQFVPNLTVEQDVNEFGQLHYAHIVEDTMHLEAWLKGRCGNNWRVQSARINSCFPDQDGTLFQGSVEVCPASAGLLFPTQWSTSLSVDQSKLTFGPHEAHLTDVPTDWLTTKLTAAGEANLVALAEMTHQNVADLRALDHQLLENLRLTFVMTCRRYFGNNTHVNKTHKRYFPLSVTYKGARVSDGELEISNQPPEQPPVPIPFGELTDRTHIKSANLMIIADDVPDRCGIFLSGTFTTSGPTVVTYRIVDALGAKSPQHEVTVDQSGVAFVSHEVDFGEGSGSTIGFINPSAEENPQPGISFSGALVDVPSDNLQGYFFFETISPHKSASNIASYNLANCTAEHGPGGSFFDAKIMGDPEEIHRLFSSKKTQYPASK